eukprot:GHRR01032267.1.p1 GENE.GHRR01032267.1~~GHRR01032267.1.p1  ORF type:complete len:110 (-),score=38.97 GHRR01032267.1:484-813(-)
MPPASSPSQPAAASGFEGQPQPQQQQVPYSPIPELVSIAALLLPDLSLLPLHHPSAAVWAAGQATHTAIQEHPGSHQGAARSQTAVLGQSNYLHTHMSQQHISKAWTIA